MCVCISLSLSIYIYIGLQYTLQRGFCRIAAALAKSWFIALRFSPTP